MSPAVSLATLAGACAETPTARAQFAFNTLSRVSPVSHGVCNVVKRVVIIGTSVVFFGTTLTTKTKLGAARMPWMLRARARACID